MNRAIAAAWLAVAALPPPGAGQSQVAIAGGVLRGTVTDTVRGRGLSYALVTVVGADRRAFANEQGAFAIAGLKAGPDRIRVQQIGYAPLEIPVLLVEPSPEVPDRLTIALGAKVQVLPDLVVTGEDFRTYRQPKNCAAPPNALTGASAQLVIDQAVTNADRPVGRWVDTLALNPARRGWYRRGAVIPKTKRGMSDAVYFTMGDLAREEFQRAHCVWYVGLDSAETGRVQKIAFAPAPGVKTADWAGELQFDPSFQLVRSDAWLVQIDRRSAIRAARCAVRYGGEIPTIVHEQVALCLTDTGRRDAATSRDVYRVLATRFLGPRPGESH